MPREVKRGEIYWVDWNPSRGSEQAGKRPALIIQNDIGNIHSPTTIVAACTTAQVRPYPFIVSFTTRESGLSKGGSVNFAQMITIDKPRLCDKAGELSKEKMVEVDDAIKNSLGLD
ncbi:MAG: type II toxin-antitoxin system PemK/MazF family toxin [Dehalococcoidia bacterium]